MDALYPGMTTRLALMCGVGLALTSACVDEPLLTAIEQAASCTKFICGTNSPIVGGSPFFELDQTGVTPAPESGLRIVSFQKGWLPMSVEVNGAQLGGRTFLGELLTGDQLVGSTLVVENDRGEAYQLNFEQRDQTQRYWEGGDDGTGLESWYLTWNVLGDTMSTPRRMCPHTPRATGNSALFSQAHYAMIFRGDRYDAITGKVIATGEAAGPWFNIACAGDVLSKLLLIRHVEAAQDASHQANQFQRQAAIRMFRADYCGTGPNTELGVDLDWSNVGGWNVLEAPATPDNVEAIWNRTGAVCVNNPRLLDDSELPCKRAKCTEYQVQNWQQLGYSFITINP